jgi:DNA-binding transcriptional LysR family regulator
MEMHQVRYFLAVARTLNFTRAAEECNVAQPSLTRAIKQLEAELGGDLFRRERPAAQLTELGQRMLPLLKQCYDAAAGARSLASSFKHGNIGTLRIAITEAVGLELLLPHLEKLKRQFSNLKFRLLRGNSKQVLEYLRKGEAELGIAAEIDDEWERLDRWQLFTEPFEIAVNQRRPLASRDVITFGDLTEQDLLCRSYCECASRLGEALRAHDIDLDRTHAISSQADLITMLEADFGIALMPRSVSLPHTLRRVALEGFGVERTVQLFGVAGRERTAVATAFMKMLRSTNWEQLLPLAMPPVQEDRRARLSVVA